MSKKDIEKFISNNNSECFFTGGIKSEKIEEIEKDLNVILPESYKWFLRKYGLGGMFGVEILGCGKTGIPLVVTQTKRYREIGLPLNYVVINDYGEFVYCLNLLNGSEQDCEVISWDRVHGVRQSETNGFYDFLLREFQEGKELWDEDF